MRFGVNYTPSTGWFHHWLDFSLDDVKADFEAIAGLGLDHVRVFPLWPVFQPNRGLVRPRAVEQLGQVLDAAHEFDLDVQVDVLQGHLSSFDFYPSWVQTWHRANIFTDPAVISGQKLYVRTLAEALRDRPNFLGFTLGNEVNLLTESNPCTPEQAAEWIDTLLAECAKAAPDHPHVHSEYDAVWYESEHSFLPEHAANKGAMTTVHSWVFNGTAQRYGPMSPESVHHAEYLVELAKAHAKDPQRPVWLQEVGAAQPEISADQAPDFAEQTLANVLTCANLWGVTWWCSFDVDRALVDFPEREYELGLMTTERKVKPLGEVIARTVRQARETPPVPAERTSITLHGDRPSWGPGGAFFEEWMALARTGVRASIELG